MVHIAIPPFGERCHKGGCPKGAISVADFES